MITQAAQMVKEMHCAVSAEELQTMHAALHALGEHLPGINQLLDESFAAISSQFVDLASMLSAHHARSMESFSGSDEQRSNLDASYNAMAGLISKTIVDMQFQDRVSQNLVIVINIAKLIAEKLETKNNDASLDLALTQQLFYLLNLGEIKQKFISYAQQRGFMKDPAEYGVSVAVEEKKDEDDIELF